MNRKKFSKEEVGHFLIHHFCLDRLNSCGEGKKGILNYVNKVSCIQQDPLNIIGTNIDIILSSRFSEYTPEMVQEILYKDQLLIEGWDKEASIYPSSEWSNYSFIRKKSEEGSLGSIKYRNQEDALQYSDKALQAIENSHTPLSSKELQFGKTMESKWGSSDIGNIILSHLWSKGDIVIGQRNGRRKFYKSSKNLNKTTKLKNEKEFIKWYIYRRLSGLGAYWLKNGAGWQGHYMEQHQKIVEELIDDRLVFEIEVEGLKHPLYITAENYEILFNCCEKNKTLSPLRFIAPLDNFIWDRQFIKEIFNFEYVWEVYKPVEKRKYGYYVIPIIYKDKFIGRFEPSRDKKRNSKLKIENLWFESDEFNTSEIHEKIYEEVDRFNRSYKNN